MSYSAVPTKATGDTWSADDNNTYIKDNFAAGVPDIFTTKGDLAVATAANTAARLAAGTNGYALVADSGEATGLKYAQIAGISTAYARYKISGAITTSTGTAKIINYDTSVYDPDTAVTTGASWKYTITTGKDGYYLVVASCYLTADADWTAGEYAQLWLYKNNSASNIIGAVYIQTTGTQAVFVQGATLIALSDNGVSANDYIDVRLLQNSGGDVAINADGNYTHISIARLY